MRRQLLWGGLGALAVGLSKGVEGMGDSAFAAGNRGGALTSHLLALAFLLGALVCGWMFFRSLVRKQGSHGTVTGTDKRDAQVFEDAPKDEGLFDPDAALASYLAKRDQSPPPAAPPTQGFGRRIS